MILSVRRNRFAMRGVQLSLEQLEPRSLPSLSLTPNSIAEGSGAFTLTVNGSGFSSTSTVEWNATPLPTTYVSSSQVQAAVPAADVADEGKATITVVNPGPTDSAEFLISENDALSATGYNLAGIEGNEINGIVATFTDATYPTNSPSDFAANINCGDGSTSAGTVTSQGNLFAVRGSHTYAEKGSYSMTVAIQDDGSGVASASTTSTIAVADAPLTATGKPVAGTEGLGITSGDEIATFTDGNPNASAGDFTAVIDWGNGTSSQGIISSLGNGMFQVIVPLGINGGTITSPNYPEEGHYTITTTITDKDGSQAIATGTATVADAPLTATGTPVHAAEGVAFSGQLATITDANPNATINDFMAQLTFCITCGPTPLDTIDWGDGQTSTGQITQPGGLGTPFVVKGSHTYATAGTYTIQVSIRDVGGSTATATTTATVVDPNDIVSRAKETGQIWVGVSTGSSFNSSLWATWSPGANWVDVLTGDFNGDGLTDMAARDANTGAWWVALSTGSSFTTTLWDTWSTHVTWTDVQVGDFNGDGKMDIIGRPVGEGHWWVGVSTGSSFATSLWETWSAVTWVDVKVGDFNGDGKADITGRDMQTGAWWTGVSTGSSFKTSLWAIWSTAVTWVDVQVGDFDGDGTTDIIGRVLESGDWWVALSRSTSFAAASVWATWSASVTWVDVHVGDFNRDGASDIVGRALETGQWWVGLSRDKTPPPGVFIAQQPAFSTTLWSTWSTGVTWVDVQVGDFNGDGQSDITGRALETGQWWTGLSNGSSFTNTLWATWSTGVTWTGIRSGDFA